MNFSGFSRLMIINFVSAILITIMVCWVLLTLDVEYIVYLGAFVGMYVFAGYGINLIVDDEIIPNNYSRFILAIVCIIIYSVVFIYMMPIVFSHVVIFTEYTLASVGFTSFGGDIVLNKEFFLTIFGIIVLILNYLDYRKQ